ncbi:hypothetical protein BH23VER1_BH23VER1_03930 [soil metagenome]
MVASNLQLRLLPALVLAAAPLATPLAAAPPPGPAATVVERFCLECHDTATTKGDLDLERLLDADVSAHLETWELAVRQLRARQMPPVGKDRPDEAGYDAAAAALESQLDAAAATAPRPGRTSSVRRLTRIEYRNAIRDLLALPIDPTELLPSDESAHGFDNITVTDLSPSLLERYITAAQKISRLAVGTPLNRPAGRTIRVRPDLTQEGHIEGLPLGTRGGALISHNFPLDGEYEVTIRLARDRNEEVEGLRETHQLELLLDGQHVRSFEVKPPKNNAHATVDAHLHLRLPVEAGPHELGVTFVEKSSSLEETLRKPYAAHFNVHRHPRLSPAIYQVSIVGPFGEGTPGETPSRKRIFVSDDPEEIVSALARRAYRRPVTAADLERPLAFFNEARAAEGFEAGIEAALSALLVSPSFLFRIEKDPADLPPETPYPITDLELASRLSFFLWSSIPDDELLAVAERGELREPPILAEQTRRLLADPRAGSLVENFAGQWLYLRNLESFTPDGRLYPDFDDNLRQALRRETELLVDEVVREDRSVLDLLASDHTYLNGRLARHYGIPHIYGDRFRRVALPAGSGRGGILRHGSILTVTSYATRTSPVIRGHWVLKNLLGTPPPPPPPDIPSLDDRTVDADLPMRERLAEHRANPACASCHDVMDPVGFAMENYDAVGRWRTHEDGRPVDALGGLPGGAPFQGVGGLEEGLLERPEIFVRTLTEKLLTFALGRGIGPDDAPAVRAIVRSAAAQDYRFSSVILGIVKSPPFTMRTTPTEDAP